MSERIVIKDYLRDSTIWDHIIPRPDDIVIASCYKSGTTLLQQIVNLMVNRHDDFDYLHDISPWIEHTGDPLEEKIQQIEKLPHRRFFKTHLPFEALPYHPHWRYVCAIRDGRDVGMSLFNHVHALTPKAKLTSPVSFHKPASDFSEFWDEWIETGKPYWDFFEFINSWLKVRQLPNVLLVHYTDLIHEKLTQIEMISQFLNIEFDNRLKKITLNNSSLEYMKQKSEKFEHRDFEKQRFIYKGTNKRWKGLLSEQQLKRYDELLVRKFDTAWINWIKNGGSLPLFIKNLNADN